MVTPYRYQQQRIKEALEELSLAEREKEKSGMNESRERGKEREKEGGKEGVVEVNTIDRYQGRDKDCIIISFVRSNSNKNVSIYIKWRNLSLIRTPLSQIKVS